MSLERDEPDLRVKNLADSVLEHLHAGEKASDSKDIDDQIVEVYTKYATYISQTYHLHVLIESASCSVGISQGRYPKHSK